MSSLQISKNTVDNTSVLKFGGNQSDNYDAKITVTKGSTENGKGDLSIKANTVSVSTLNVTTINLL